MKKQLGLTLIEVLIALAIVAIALTAVIKATSQGIRGTGYLKAKTLAGYVGQQVLNEIRIGAIKLSDNETTTNEVDYLDNTYYWRAEETATSNPHIVKLLVHVYAKKPDENPDSLIDFETYRYHAE